MLSRLLSTPSRKAGSLLGAASTNGLFRGTVRGVSANTAAFPMLTARSMSLMRQAGGSRGLAATRAAHALQAPINFAKSGRFFSSSSSSNSSSSASAKGDKGVSRWLFVCSGLVFTMVVVGGLTRLTKSGLSMTDWKLTGSMFPIGQEQWEAEFTKYKQSPEFEKTNKDMPLEDFKFIFFWEYGHRMLGRVIGLSFALPLAFFWARGRLNIPGMHLKPKLLGVGGLILSQGLIGWWMVRSGLEEPEFKSEEPKVSPYRLATHLLSAFAIYTCLFTTALEVRAGPALAEAAVYAPKKLRVAVAVTTGLVGLTVASGAFVAGNRAGLCYNEFPLMGGRWMPEDIVDPKLQPVWRNVFENSSLVQFDHRWLGITTGTAIAGLWACIRTAPVNPAARMAANAMVGMAGVQISLGIATLLYLVPIPLAASHQAGSLTLFTICLYLRHAIVRGKGRAVMPARSSATSLPGQATRALHTSVRANTKPSPAHTRLCQPTTTHRDQPDQRGL